MEDCWQSTLANSRKAVLRVDLTGVTFIDATGKAYLAVLQRRGAEFVAADCLTKAIVAEITKAPIPGCGRRKREGESQT